MELGKKIKSLRLQKGVTQETLAGELGVTAQAVSKWENGTTLPDIQLLPTLSVYFGVSIDELFEMTDEAHFDRIDNMLESEAFLSRADFDRAMEFLKDKASDPALEGKCLTMLADCCNHRADGYRKKAEQYAKRALEIEPHKKANHSILNMATQSAIWDWNCSNHHEQIAWYRAFMEKHPEYHRGYLWLLDMLVADGRLREAAEVVDKMEALEKTYHVPLYRGHIAYRAGRFDEAEQYWHELMENYPDNWLTWSCMGDARAKAARYEEAIPYYRKAIELEEKPRFIDNYESIAHICEILGDHEGAIDAYRHVIGILVDEYGTDSESESVQRYERKIRNLSLN
ncbi:MAG: helix-turn-helix domain-containing protein [Lachnospiraceae bacterium]|nr:helix-turn-helix domain-containing protein [Lachnospiraceae bacterium]